jgi:hypothetical protein
MLMKGPAMAHAGSEHVAATPNDERRAVGSDNFSGVPVFSVFHNEDNEDRSIFYC